MKIYYRIRAVWEIRRAIYNLGYWLDCTHVRQPAYGTWGWAIQSGTAAREDHPGYVAPK